MTDNDSPVLGAIIHRIMVGRTDLLAKYGPQSILSAAEDVADWVGDVEEIGSSDVSGWVKQVERMLEENPPEAFGVKEDINPEDVGEYDREGDMAKSDLRSIMLNASRLHDMLGDGDNLPEWVQSKLTVAEDYLSTVVNYLSAQAAEPMADMPESAVNEGNNSSLDSILARHADAVEEFKKGGDMGYDLESDLWDYYFSQGDIRNYDADASEWLTQRLADELGLDEQAVAEGKTGNAGYDSMLAVMKAVDAGQDATFDIAGEPITLEYPEARFLAGKYKAFLKAGRQEEFLKYMENPVTFDRLMKQLRDLIDKQKNFRGSIPGERGVEEAQGNPATHPVFAEYGITDVEVKKAEQFRSPEAGTEQDVIKIISGLQGENPKLIMYLMMNGKEVTDKDLETAKRRAWEQDQSTYKEIEIGRLPNRMFFWGIKPEKYGMPTVATMSTNEAAKNPYAIGMAQAMKSTGDTPPLKKSTIKKAHKIADAIKANESLAENEYWCGIDKKVKAVPEGYKKLASGYITRI